MGARAALFTDPQPLLCHLSFAMRMVQIVVAAVMLGVAAGYAWSALLPQRMHVHVPKAEKTAQIEIPRSAADEEWAARAADNGVEGAEGQNVYYRNCAEARAAGRVSITSGEPGYRSGLDADRDGIACEPYSGS